MKKRAPVWPVVLILTAALLIGLMSAFNIDEVTIDQKWVAAIALALLVIRVIFLIQFGNKLSNPANPTRLRARIHRGYRDKN